MLVEVDDLTMPSDISNSQQQMQHVQQMQQSQQQQVQPWSCSSQSDSEPSCVPQITREHMWSTSGSAPADNTFDMLDTLPMNLRGCLMEAARMYLSNTLMEGTTF